MTQTALRLKTRALVGKKIEVTIPELDEGEEIEIIVLRSTEPTPNAKERVSLFDFVQSVPSGPRPYQTWEEYEQALQEEKEAWER